MTTLHGLMLDLVPNAPDFDDRVLEFWNNESRLWATMGDCDPVSRARMERIKEEWRTGRERGYTGVHFIMRTHSTPTREARTIGSTGLNWIDLWNRVGNLGAWIGDPDYWSGGYGTDALLLVIEYAFDWLDLRRLTLGTMDINERARRNVEKCGFVLEGRRRKMALVSGQWIDEMSYGLLRDEWPGRQVLIERLALRERAAQLGLSISQ